MSLRSKALLAGSAFGLGAGAATARLRGGQAPPPPAPGPSREELVVEAITETLTSREEPPWHLATPVTDALRDRLDEDDLARLDAAMEGHARDLWDMSDEYGRRRLAVSLTAWYGLEPGLTKMGVTSAAPPEEVHAMARGPLAAGGDPGVADLVVSMLDVAGVALADGATVLDFGCSSGRVLRAIAAWRPDLACVGCDPNEAAIAWAREHLPMARFFVSPGAPPLDEPEASIDVAYAVSIWSHFAEPQALAWLEEMHRVIKPGGALLITTHGLDTLATLLRREHMTRESATEVALDFLAHGHRWYDVFGEDGDWGVKDTGWGNSYLSMEWLLSHATPDWSVRLLRPGAVDQNQDVIVLERRP